jgi:diadenosine tetraphosphate (Ap4A) HIT family hydrolase
VTFELHPQLKKDCLVAGDLPLCRVLLMNNRNFPWLILVPRQEGLREIFELDDAEYRSVMEEIKLASYALHRLTGADKMNVAALGNQVPQLHIHVIARFKNDAAWPNPVWNSGAATAPYPPEDAEALLKKTRLSLGLHPVRV